jgi:glycosyltransferase involved in cell wall biosynthesis
MATSSASSASSASSTRVALFGTHPKQFNGYSKVVYELCKHVEVSHADLQLHVFGFQNMHNHPEHRMDAMTLPGVVEVYDAMAHEEPRARGFGEKLVKSYVARVRPHVCVVFNDLSVLNAILNELKDAPSRAEFKVIAYIDQVYLYQKREHLAFVNAHADAAIAFTPEWRDCLVRQGLTRPCHVLVHGINPASVFPIPRPLARRFFALPEKDFLVLNLNRNQPRKRWDVCLQAFAEVVARLPDAPIKMVVGTELKGAWDLVEVYRRELTKRGVPLDK